LIKASRQTCRAAYRKIYTAAFTSLPTDVERPKKCTSSGPWMFVVIISDKYQETSQSQQRLLANRLPNRQNYKYTQNQ